MTSDKQLTEDEAEKAFATQWAQQEELAKTLSAQISGNVPQIKRHERGQLLGQFRERVLWGTTLRAIGNTEIMESFRRALENPHAAKLLVRADFTTQAMPYIKEAQKKQVAFTFVQSPEFSGEVAMVLAADQAVDVSDAIREQ